MSKGIRVQSAITMPVCIYCQYIVLGCLRHRLHHVGVGEMDEMKRILKRPHARTLSFCHNKSPARIAIFGRGD